VPAGDAPVEFTPPLRNGAASSAGSSAAHSSSAGQDGDSAKLECRYIVIEWQSAAFSDKGAFDKEKVNNDEASNSGVGCGRKPAGAVAGGGGVELRSCLDLFSREETLDADNVWYCPRCKDFRQATKKIQFWSLPPVLVLQIKRFSAQGMWRRKNETNVNFPFHLDLGSYVLHPAEDGDEYELISVSNHYGNTGGGHYTAFAKHSDVWHEFNDSSTTVVEADKVITPAAYVLMYAKRTVMKSKAPDEPVAMVEEP